MAKAAKLTDSEQVTAHIQKLAPAISDMVQLLRDIILSTDSEVGERIKWNNPSFYYTGEMPPFDPKEYKRDMIVFNLYKNRVMLVFPSGARIGDTTGLLQGDYADGRRTIVFTDMQHIAAQKDTLQNAIRKWLQLVEK